MKLRDKVIELQEENRKKYGDKENDTIAIQFRIHPLCGLGECHGFIHKYLLRYLSDSEKAKNELDLVKSIDLIDRLYNHFPIKELKILEQLIETDIEKALLYNIEVEGIIINFMI